MIDLDTAIEVFVRSFALGRSMYRPCTAKRIGEFWLVHDVEAAAGESRSDEWTLFENSDLVELQSVIDEHSQSRAHRLCVAGTNVVQMQSLKAKLCDSGYRYLRREPLMAIATCDREVRCPQHEVIRVQTAAQADELNSAAHARQILPHHLDPNSPTVRAYYAMKAGAVAGFVRCIALGADACYVAGVETFPQFRRMGIATDLMNTMISDDCKLGIPYSVLLASRLGEQLYTSLGYRVLGSVHVYSQRRTTMQV